MGWQVLGYLPHQHLDAPWLVACKQLALVAEPPCGHPVLPLQPIAGADAPSRGHAAALAMLFPTRMLFSPRYCLGRQEMGLSSTATCLSVRLSSATARKIQLLLGIINSPIMPAIDLTDFINPAHSQQLPFSTLRIIWNRIPVEQCGVFALGANEFTVINACTTNYSGMQEPSLCK